MVKSKETKKSKKSKRQGSSSISPTPQVLQRAARLVLAGKCKLSKPSYSKLKKHRNILRKLAAMKGKAQSKKAFVTRHKKQIGGFIGMLPMIARAAGAFLPAMLTGLVR